MKPLPFISGFRVTFNSSEVCGRLKHCSVWIIYLPTARQSNILVFLFSVWTTSLRMESCHCVMLTSYTVTAVFLEQRLVYEIQFALMFVFSILSLALKFSSAFSIGSQYWALLQGYSILPWLQTNASKWSAHRPYTKNGPYQGCGSLQQAQPTATR